MLDLINLEQTLTDLLAWIKIKESSGYLTPEILQHELLFRTKHFDKFNLSVFNEILGLMVMTTLFSFEITTYNGCSDTEFIEKVNKYLTTTATPDVKEFISILDSYFKTNNYNEEKIVFVLKELTEIYTRETKKQLEKFTYLPNLSTETH